jgi:hypothetical protein
LRQSALLGSAGKKRSKIRLIKEICHKKWKSLDYVAGWFMKAEYSNRQMPLCFVSTTPAKGSKSFSLATRAGWKHGYVCHRPFKWSNLAQTMQE